MTPARRVGVLCVTALASLLASEVAMAGILDLLFGGGPLLEQRTRIGPEGLALRGDFRVGKACSYQFEVRLLHQHGQMHELDQALGGGSVFPVPVDVRVTRTGDDPAEVARFAGPPTLSGQAQTMTIFNAGHASLGKGRYHVEVKSGAVPQLAGVDVDFVVQIRPKTSC